MRECVAGRESRNFCRSWGQEVAGSFQGVSCDFGELATDELRPSVVPVISSTAMDSDTMENEGVVLSSPGTRRHLVLCAGETQIDLPFEFSQHDRDHTSDTQSVDSRGGHSDFKGDPDPELAPAPEPVPVITGHLDSHQVSSGWLQWIWSLCSASALVS